MVFGMDMGQLVPLIIEKIQVDNDPVEHASRHIRPSSIEIAANSDGLNVSATALFYPSAYYRRGIFLFSSLVKVTADPQHGVVDHLVTFRMHRHGFRHDLLNLVRHYTKLAAMAPSITVFGFIVKQVEADAEDGYRFGRYFPLHSDQTSASSDYQHHRHHPLFPWSLKM